MTGSSQAADGLFARAIALARREGGADVGGELDWLLRGLPPVAPPAVLDGQNADGGWPAPESGGRSAIDATCARLARAYACGVPFDSPALRAAADFLAGRQRPDGGCEDEAGRLRPPLSGARSGEARAPDDLTAQAGLWLSALGDDGAAARACDALERSSAPSPFGQTRWLRSALRARLGRLGRADDALRGSGDALAGLEADDLARRIQALRMGGIAQRAPAVSEAADHLLTLRGAEGGWGQGAGRVRVTLDALAAFRAAGWPLTGAGGWRIETLDAEGAAASEGGLAALLVDAVAGGASVGYLPPLSDAEARGWARSVGAAVAEGGRVVLVARAEDRIVGSAQLDLSLRANGLHRAEVAKVMTLTAWRGRGVARSLMLAADDEARRLRRGTLLLDTREGDPSELLYQSLGWVKVGAVPRYARSAGGALHATAFYYKLV